MPLNFVQPMGHINSLNNKILYGKTGELCSSLLYTSRVQGDYLHCMTQCCYKTHYLY